MARVHLTRHLYVFFPQLEGQALRVDGDTVGDIIRSLDEYAPGLTFYICDERGALRTHVNVFIDKQLIRDRRGLSDPVPDGAELHILQALSGG